MRSPEVPQVSSRTAARCTTAGITATSQPTSSHWYRAPSNSLGRSDRTMPPAIGTIRMASGLKYDAKLDVATTQASAVTERLRQKATAATTARLQKNAADGLFEAECDHRSCSGIRTRARPPTAAALRSPVVSNTMRKTAIAAAAESPVFIRCGATSDV